MVEKIQDEEDIFKVAAAIPSSDTRRDYLVQVCGEDYELLERLLTLLRAHENAPDFLESPPADVVVTEIGPFSAQSGDTIGPYKLREQIGEGGFGLVYVAEQEKPVSRKVALKIIKPGMDTKNVVARFEAERQALAMMDHPNIAKVLDAGTADNGRPYFVMELVKGIPITEFCDQQSLTNRQRLQLFVDVCRAVQHAHQKGIIHRDLKPSNIMVTMRDDKSIPKVIDFGVAKALSTRLTEKTVYTSYGQMIGTPLYMSPEQAQMNEIDVDTRSDVYSLGVVLYELLTGTTPFDRDTIRKADFDQLRRIIKESEPVRPSHRISTMKNDLLSTVTDKRRLDARRLSQSLKGELDWIVMKALEKDRNRRYESASAFAADVERQLNDEPVQACPPSLGYLLLKRVRKHRIGTAIATMAMLVLVAVAISGFIIASHIKDKAERDRLLSEQRQEVNQDLSTALARLDGFHEQLGRSLHKDGQILEQARGTLEHAQVLAKNDLTDSDLKKKLGVLQSILQAEEDYHELASRFEELRLSTYSSPELFQSDDEGFLLEAWYLDFLEKEGIDLYAASSSQSIENIKARPERERRILISAMYSCPRFLHLRERDGFSWSSRTEKRRMRENLFAILTAIDNEPWRNNFRKEIWEPRVAGEEVELSNAVELSQKINFEIQPVDVVVSVADLFDYPFKEKREDAINLLKDCFNYHPSDYLLALEIARVSYSQGNQHKLVARRTPESQVSEWFLPQSAPSLERLIQNQSDYHYSEAIRFYTIAATLCPQSKQLRIELVEKLQGLHREKDALDVIEQSVRDFSGKDVLLFKAMRHEYRGNLKQAIEFYQSYLAEEPENWSTVHTIMELHGQLGDTDAIVALLETFVAHNPQHDRAISELCYYYRQRRDRESAKKVLRKACEHILRDQSTIRQIGVNRYHSILHNLFREEMFQELHDTYRWIRARIKRGQVWDDRCFLQELRTKFTRNHLFRERNFPDIYFLDGYYLYLGSGDEGTRLIEYLAELYPNDPLNLVYLAKRRMIEEPQEAIQLCRKALDMAPNDMAAVWAQVQIGHILGYQKKYTEAANAYRKVLEITQPQNDPQALQIYVELMFWAGDALSRVKDYPSAIEAIERCREAERTPVTLSQLDFIEVSDFAGFRWPAEKYSESGHLWKSNFLWRLLGSLYLKTEQYSKSIEAFRNTIALDPRATPGDYSCLAVSLFRDGQYEAAAEYFQTSDEMLEGKDFKHRMFYAMNEWYMGHQERAIELYQEGAGWMLAMKQNEGEQLRFRQEAETLMGLAPTAEELQSYSDNFPTDILERFPEDQIGMRIQKNFGTFLTNRSWNLSTTSNPDERQPEHALLMAEYAVEYRPEEEAAWQVLGWARYRNGQYQEAISALQKSIELQGNGGDNYQRFFLAMAYWQLGDQEQAFSEYAQCVAQMAAYNRNSGRQAQFRAEAEALFGIDVKRRQELVADYFSNRSPEDTTITFLLHRGRWSVHQGEYEQGVADLTKVLEEEPEHAEAFARRGAALTRSQRWEEAIQDLDEAIRLSYNSVWPHIDRSEAHLSLNHLDAALSDAQYAVKKKSTNREAWLRLLLASKAQSDWQQTADAIHKILELEPNHETWVEWYYEVLLLRASGQQEKLAEYSQKLLHEHAGSEDPNTLKQLTYVLKYALDTEGNRKSLVTVARKAYPNPQSVDDQFHLAMCLYYDGQYTEALELLNQAIEKPWGLHSYTRLYLAMTHYQLGHMEKAHSWWNKAIAILDRQENHDEESQFLATGWWAWRWEMKLIRQEAAKLLKIKTESTPVKPEPEVTVSVPGS